MKQRIVVGLCLLAGVLGVISGLRDLFAPGLFTISGQVKGTADIVLGFVAAAFSFGAAALFYRTLKSKSPNHK